jgi:peptidoglycan/xylan/chitin deacetylase (PgdA/CDA1 family)
MLSAAMEAAGAGLTAGLGAGLGCYAALWPQSQIFGRQLIAGDNQDEIALTYDDGPNGDTTLWLLDVLAARRAPAAFFLIGQYVRQQPQIVRRLVEAGHIVGNHTVSHPVLAFQSSTRIREELAGCNAAIEDAIGAPVRYFRPPHGARRPAVLRIARELGLTPVQWNATGYDWAANSSDEIVRNIRQDMARNRGRHRGSNILLHDGGQHGLGQPREATIEATARLLAAPPAGMRFVSLNAWS